MTQQVATVQQADMFSLLDPAINTVFAASPITNKQNKEIGVAIAAMARSKIAEANGLKTGKNDKDELDAIVLKQSDGLLSTIKSRVAGLDATWTAKGARVWTDKEGDVNMSIRLKSVKRSMSEEKLALGIFPADKYPGMTMEQRYEALTLLRKSQEAQLAGKTVDVPEVPATEAKTPAPATPELTEAELMAALEAEEKAHTEAKDDAEPVMA